MENQENEKMQWKIKMLIDKANSTDSPQEAEALMMKANELLLKYNLDASHVMSKEQVQKTGVQEDTIGFDEEWHRVLMSTICKHNLCDMLISRYNGRLHVIGRPANVNAVIMMYDFYRTAILRIAMDAYKTYLKEDEAEMGVKIKRKAGHEDKFINAYIGGAIDGAGKKMKEQMDYMKQGSGSMALVTLNEDAVAKYIREKYPNLGYSSSSFRTSAGSGAYAMGQRDGYGLGGAQVGAGAKRIGN